MRRALVAAAIVVLAAGAFIAGRASRSEPPEPNRAAERVRIDGIEAERWRLADVEVPELVTPEPTPAPTQAAPPAAPTPVPDETSTDTGTAPIEPAPTTVTAPPPSGTGGSTGGGEITGDTE